MQHIHFGENALIVQNLNHFKGTLRCCDFLKIQKTSQWRKIKNRKNEKIWKSKFLIFRFFNFFKIFKFLHFFLFFQFFGFCYFFQKSQTLRIVSYLEWARDSRKIGNAQYFVSPLLIPLTICEQKLSSKWALSELLNEGFNLRS